MSDLVLRQLMAHHEAAVLGRTIGVSPAEAWGRPCPLCEQVIQERTTIPDWDQAKVMQVIRTTLTRRGRGDPDSPVRIITQYWSLDGQLLAEVDPTKAKPS